MLGAVPTGGRLYFNEARDLFQSPPYVESKDRNEEQSVGLWAGIFPRGQAKPWSANDITSSGVDPNLSRQVVLPPQTRPLSALTRDVVLMKMENWSEFETGQDAEPLLTASEVRKHGSLNGLSNG